MPRAYATIYVPGRTTSHKRSSGPIRNRNSLSDDTTRLDGHSLHMSWSHSSLTTGTEIVIAMVSISHSSTHNTVSHHNIVWVDNKAESRGDPFSKRRKWSDARDADARRQRRPSDHQCTSTNMPLSTQYRTEYQLRLPPPPPRGALQADGKRGGRSAALGGLTPT